jgi:hypothetical protein
VCWCYGVVRLGGVVSLCRVKHYSSSDSNLVVSLFNYQDDARSNKLKMKTVIPCSYIQFMRFSCVLANYQVSFTHCNFTCIVLLVTPTRAVSSTCLCTDCFGIVPTPYCGSSPISLVNIQNVSVTKIVDSSSIQRAETKYGLIIQFLAPVFMIHEVWLNA